ncbi:glycosyl transferase [Vibrio ishigakensis]|uniref:Glycosyl transferase n=1 Tax=Vibrio ishigakensis TaxID=1481914 RepID=A0A0B8QGN3_9VIBR|nr:glycosyl transferase [Vibrio ishigakensis]
MVDRVCIYENSEEPLLNEQQVHQLNSKLIYRSDTSNQGYGYGHNQAFTLCQSASASKYHLVMNLDVTVSDETIELLLKHMERSPKTLHCMPKILNPNGSIQPACKLVPTPINLLTRRFLPEFFSHFQHQIAFELRDYDYKESLNCPYLSGCFMLLRSAAFKQVGMFDTQFFMYPEDIDLTRRLHRLGKTECIPSVSIVHQHAKESYKSWRMTWIHIKSMVKYFNKWGWFIDNERRALNRSALNRVRSQEDS